MGKKKQKRKETNLFDCGIWNGDFELKLIRGGRQWKRIDATWEGVVFFRLNWVSPWEDTCVAI